jgi:hypothetical protein
MFICRDRLSDLCNIDASRYTNERRLNDRV